MKDNDGTHRFHIFGQYQIFQNVPVGPFQILTGLLFFNVHYTNEKRIQFDLGNVQYLCYTAGSL